MDTLGKDLTGRYEAAFDPDSKKGGNANLPALSIHILAPDTVETILDRQQPRG
jgi:hypothetical protein